jgi:hypothetical protein
MAYDAPNRVIVLYGGLVQDQNEGREAGDTWTWNGSDWTEVGPLDGPPGDRDGPRMVSTPEGPLLFGGRISNLKYYRDLWRWDGKTWVAEAPAHPPAGRSSAAVAYDPDHGSLFVFGGTGVNAGAGPGAQGTPLGDAWLAAGGEWVQVLVPGSPPALSFADAHWDPTNKRVLVMFGIVCPKPVNDSWAWESNAAWSHTASVSVPARWGAAAADDGAGNVLVFGGSDEEGC